MLSFAMDEIKGRKGESSREKERERERENSFDRGAPNSSAAFCRSRPKELINEQERCRARSSIRELNESTKMENEKSNQPFLVEKSLSPSGFVPS